MKNKNPLVENINLKYAKMLLNIYAGEISEESSLHLYIYEAMALDQKYAHCKKILLKIAKEEMKHLFILGNTIKALGFLPKFVGCKNNVATFWNAGILTYPVHIIKMWKNNIEIEEKTICEYRNLQEHIKDPYIQKNIGLILQDEYKHVKIFKYFLEEFTMQSKKDIC